MSNLIIVLIFMFVSFYFCLRKLQNFWKDRGFPSTKFVFPFGSIKGVGTEKSLCVALDEFYKEFKGKGPAIGMFYFVKPMVLVIEPDLIRQVLIQNFDNFQNRSLYYNKEDDPISGHLLALEGKDWRERRVKLTPTFSTGKIKMMFEPVNKIGDQLVFSLTNLLNNNSEKNVEMHDMLARFSIDCISNVAFGLDTCSLHDTDSEFRKYSKEVVDFDALAFLKLLFTTSFPDLSRKMHLTVNKQSVIDFFYSTFVANIEHREKTNTYRNDFIQILLELKKSKTLSVSELSAESFIFFLGGKCVFVSATCDKAGFETSSCLMTLTLYELALNLEIQEKLRDEILGELAGNDGILTYETVSNFKYLDMVLREGLRKYPPAYFISRKSTRDFTIPGTNMTIPANTDVIINVYSLHHDPEYFPDPEKFDPERFSPDNIKKLKSFTMLAWGDGPRKCIGGRFGMLEAKIGIAKIIQKFKFTACEKTSIPLEFVPSSFFMTPTNKMWLKVKKIA